MNRSAQSVSVQIFHNLVLRAFGILVAATEPVFSLACTLIEYDLFLWDLSLVDLVEVGYSESGRCPETAKLVEFDVAEIILFFCIKDIEIECPYLFSPLFDSQNMLKIFFRAIFEISELKMFFSQCLKSKPFRLANFKSKLLCLY